MKTLLIVFLSIAIIVQISLALLILKMLIEYIKSDKE